ncbi:MAG: helix-turn-helix transcriptional regulator [Ferruginibacter sp.]
MMTADLISRNLKVQRAMQGLSQKGIARMCNLSQAQVSKLETNSYKNGNIPSEVKQKVLAILKSQNVNNIDDIIGEFKLNSIFNFNNTVEIVKGDKDLIEELLNALEVLVKLNTNYRLRILQYEAR